MVNPKYLGVGSLLAIGVFFGLSGVIAKYLTNWLTSFQVIEYRFGIAFLLSVLLLLFSKQKVSYKSVDIKVLAAFAITFPISVVLFTLSIFHTTVSMAVFSFYAATLVASFLVGRLFFGERITWNKKIALIFVILSIICFTDPFTDFTLDLGFLFGILSGIFQAIASAYQKIVSNKTNRVSLLLVQTLSGLLIGFVSLYLQNEPFVITMPTITTLTTILYGSLFLVISYLFLVGFKYANLGVGSILVSTELFFGPFFAYLLLGERITILELLGGLLVAVAVLYANKADAYDR